MPNVKKYPGKKRERINFIVDRETKRRFRRVSKNHGLTMTDAFLRGLDLLEANYVQSVQVLKTVVEQAESGARDEGREP